MYPITQRLVLLVSAFLAWGFFSSDHSHAQKDAPDPNVVKLFFSPIDKNGKMIAALAQADVRVFDDGKPQTIFSFERMPEQPISVAVLIDTSMSQGRLQETAKLTARGFVASLMQSGRDQVAIIGFAGNPTVEQELTSEKEKVVQARPRLVSVQFYPAAPIPSHRQSHNLLSGIRLGTPARVSRCLQPQERVERSCCLVTDTTPSAGRQCVTLLKAH